MIEINALESARFGIVAARLSDVQAPLAQINAAALAQGVQMITARVDTADIARVQALEADGYRLMDVLVYHAHDLTDLAPPGASPGGEVIRPATPRDAPEVAEVARSAFAGYIGHYHADSRLLRAAADAAYVDWAERSIATTSPLMPALVAETEGRIAGFLTLRLDQAEIVLNAVRPEAQGKGIYGRLLDQALHLLQGAGSARALISTQLTNIPVQRAWARRGFRLQRSLCTLHKWV